MTLFDGLLLGLVQGVTEFIPVSSTGHLILVREIFSISEENGLAIDAILQLGTALAVAVYFRKELFSLLLSFRALILWKGRELGEEKKNLFFAVLLGTIPALVFGLFLEKYMESAFRNASLVALALIAGSILFYAAEKYASRLAKRNEENERRITPRRGFFIGLFQSLALIPGMSRSGSTISGGLFLGLSREEAARFSFLLSFPIIAGSGLLKFSELSSEGLFFSAEAIPLLAGFLVAFLSGLWAISFLLKFLKTHSLLPFAGYRIALALIIFLAL